MTWPLAFLVAVFGVAVTAIYVARVLAGLGRLQIERERDLKRAALEDVPRLREGLDVLRTRVRDLGDQTDALVARRR